MTFVLHDMGVYHEDFTIFDTSMVCVFEDFLFFVFDIISFNIPFKNLQT
jgi:hypothetical protein